MDMLNSFVGLTFQLSVPIVLGALCGTIAERGGIILLGVEGMMLLGAFAGVAGSWFTGSAFIGAVCSVAVGVLVGWIYGLFSDKPGNFIKKKRSDCTGKGPYITAVCKTTDFLNAVDIIVISSHTNSLSTFAKDIFFISS